MKFTEAHLRRIIRESLQEQFDKDISDYNDWVQKNGHITPGSSSVLASYLIDSGKDADQTLIKKLSQSLQNSDDLSKDFHDSVIQDIKSQKDEKLALQSNKSTSVKSENLKRMIRQIIKENNL